MVAVAGSEIDRSGGGLLNPTRDSLVMDRGALSAGLAPSDRGGVEPGGEVGRPVGQKREGRSAFIVVW